MATFTKALQINKVFAITSFFVLLLILIAIFLHRLSHRMILHMP